MATSTDGSWLPGIGDPTPAGWITVAAYFTAAWLCWRLVSKVGQEHVPMATDQRRFWWLLTGAMVFLGINKQLDLQTAFTEIGRAVAQSGGWYEQRHQVQRVFIVGVGSAGLALLGLLGWISWPLKRARACALGGLVFLASFVVIRAASFHHVDLLINTTLFGLRWNWIFELSGIALVATGAAFAWRDAAFVRATSAAPGPAVKAAFTPYRGPKSAAARAGTPAAVSRPTAAAPTPAPVADSKAARRTFVDERPVRSPGDPRSQA